jgi:hypothetical protein
MKKNAKTRLKLLKSLIPSLILSSIFFIIFILLVNSENPYSQKALIDKRIPIKDNVYDSLIIHEYLIQSDLPMGRFQQYRYGYFYGFNISLKQNIGKSIIIIKKWYRISWLNNIFFPTTSTSDTIFDGNFIIFSDNPPLIKQIFDNDITKKLVDLNKLGIITSAIGLKPFIINNNNIEIRLWAVNSRNEMTPEQVYKMYNLTNDNRDAVIELLLNMTYKIDELSK